MKKSGLISLYLLLLLYGPEVHSQRTFSFFRSPDRKENWILYHANPEPGRGCGRFRSPRAQKFVFRKDGTPDFGIPVEVNKELALPAKK